MKPIRLLTLLGLAAALGVHSAAAQTYEHLLGPASATVTASQHCRPIPGTNDRACEYVRRPVAPPVAEDPVYAPALVRQRPPDYGTPRMPVVVPYHPGMQIVGRHPQHAGLCVCVDRYGRRVLAPCPPQRGYAGYNQPRPYQQQYQPLPRVPQVYGFRDARIVSGVQTMPYNQNPYGNYRAPFVYNRGGYFIPPR